MYIHIHKMDDNKVRIIMKIYFSELGQNCNRSRYFVRSVNKIM